MAGFSEFAGKKVAGVPVLYLVGGFVAILLVVALKMKPKADPAADVQPSDAAGSGDTAGTDAANKMAGNYGGLNTVATVVAAPPTPATPEVVTPSNDNWMRTAVTFLIAEKHYSPGAAQVGINNYLEGNDLTFAEGQMRDAAIAKLGLPPERLYSLGKTGDAPTPAPVSPVPPSPAKPSPPAQKQINILPGTHTVKGSNDNTPGKLAALYYGTPNSSLSNTIVAWNSSLGTSYAVGTKVHIPVKPTPKYYYTKSAGENPTTIAAKNGISLVALKALNPNLSYPIPAKATVRVL